MAELVAKRYGTALYELAVDNDKVDEISNEIKELKAIFVKELELTSLLNHPKIVVEEKIKIIENIFKNNISDELLGLLVLILKKGRQNEILSIFDYCLKAFDTYNGIITAYVTSADELSKHQKRQVEERLTLLTEKKILTVYTVDQTIIGGLIIRINDRIIDNSIKGKLSKMSKSLYSL